MFGSRRGRIRTAAATMILTGLVGAPVAVATELPPPPVEPGFENVVITARPLSAPAQPVEGVTPQQAAPVAAAKPATARKAKKSTKKAAKKSKVVKKSKKASKKTAKKIARSKAAKRR